MDVIEMNKLEDILSAIEYNGGGITELKSKGCVKSVQRGYVGKFDLSAGQTKNIPISNVDSSKSFLLVYAATLEYMDFSLTNTNVAIIGKQPVGVSNHYSVSWQVVEFY